MCLSKKLLLFVKLKKKFSDNRCQEDAAKCKFYRNEGSKLQAKLIRLLYMTFKKPLYVSDNIIIIVLKPNIKS